MRHSIRSIALSMGAAVLMVLGATAGAAGDLTKADVKSKVEAAGYTNVGKIRREKNHYDATAMKDGKKVALDIDAKTGAITPESNEAEEREEHEEHHDKKDKD